MSIHLFHHIMNLVPIRWFCNLIHFPLNQKKKLKKKPKQQQTAKIDCGKFLIKNMKIKIHKNCEESVKNKRFYFDSILTHTHACTHTQFNHARTQLNIFFWIHNETIFDWIPSNFIIRVWKALCFDVFPRTQLFGLLIKISPLHTHT